MPPLLQHCQHTEGKTQTAINRWSKQNPRVVVVVVVVVVAVAMLWRQ